jgi:hypothetical protein
MKMSDNLKCADFGCRREFSREWLDRLEQEEAWNIYRVEKEYEEMLINSGAADLLKRYENV